MRIAGGNRAIIEDSQMGAMKRQLHLNLFIHSRGHHEASWRHPASSPLALTDIRYYQDLAQRSEEHTSELQSHLNLVCRLLLEKKNSYQTSEAALMPPTYHPPITDSTPSNTQLNNTSHT